MKKISDLKKLAKSHGCILEWDQSGGTIDVCLEAPEGKIFISSGCSIDCGIEGHGYINTKSNRPDLDKSYRDIEEILSYGFSDE